MYPRMILFHVTWTACLILLPACVTQAQFVPNTDWIVQYGSVLGTDSGHAVTVDVFGNIYVTGQAGHYIDGQVSYGSPDLFITKFDSSGGRLWTRIAGTAYDEEGNGIITDGDGNVYVAGYSEGDLGGTSTGYRDQLMAKYDPSGNHVWTKKFGTTYSDYANDLVIDSQGYLFTTGEVRMGGSSPAHNDAFLYKVDSAGGFVWSRNIGTMQGESGCEVAVDTSDNVYVLGQTYGDLEGANAGLGDVFVKKYDSFGGVLWTKQIGTSGSESCGGIASDSLGNIVVAVSTTGILGDASAGSNDVAVIKIDSTGNIVWTTQFGSDSSDQAYDLDVDGDDNIYVTGRTYGDFGGANAGGSDIFVSKLNSTGDVVWSGQWGTTGTESGLGVAVDQSGQLYVTGSTNGNLGGTHLGQFDIFLLKLHEVRLPGDANGDGRVDLSDLQILGDNWQSSTATWETGDFTGDGIVNLADVQILGDNWGYGTSSDLAFAEALRLAGVQVPEPGTLAMMMLSLCVCCGRSGARRKKTRGRGSS